MRRYLIALALLFPVAAQAACPTPPSSCPSPTFNSITLAVPVGVGSGGTGLASGTSGGIPGFTGSTTLASSIALTANALVLGGGAGATPTPMASLGTTTTLLHGNASGAPTFGAVGLTGDVFGILPVANGGTGLASGTSGGILGYTAAGTLASSGALANHGMLVGGGAGATPTAITAGTNGQIPVGVTAGNPVMQTLGGDVSAVTAGGSVTVSKIGGTAITLGATGTFWPGHGLIGKQTFCASGCDHTSGSAYTPTAGTTQVIIGVQAPGGGSGGCALTAAANFCVAVSSGAGSYAEGLFTTSFSGITMTIGAVGTAGTAGNNAGAAGGTTTAGALISCPGGVAGAGGASTANSGVYVVAAGGTASAAACTLTPSSAMIRSVPGQGAGMGNAQGTTAALQFYGSAGNSFMGFGPIQNNTASAQLAGPAGTGFGSGSAAPVSSASQAAIAGTAGAPGIIVVWEYN